MSIAVMVPTYMRPEIIVRCLAGIAKQSRPADQIIVVVRDSDHATRAELEQYAQQQRIQIALADKPGMIYALTTGLNAVTTDIVAITDDDAVPREDWLARIEATYASHDDRLAAVGGRDYLHCPGIDHSFFTKEVGIVLPSGVPFGFHHCGIGPARKVLFLKQVNSSYRTSVIKKIGFETALRGAAVQQNSEPVLGFQIARMGYELIYDPGILVDHYPEARPPGNDRATPQSSFRVISDEVHNMTFAICIYLNPFRLALYVLFAVLIGGSGAFGLAKTLYSIPKYGLHNSLNSYAASMHGLFWGIVNAYKSRIPTSRPTI